MIIKRNSKSKDFIFLCIFELATKEKCQIGFADVLKSLMALR